ncbi:MAG: glycoside hydrolase family 3 C-terminal domain-containing protein, partial [Anaerolineae bacterium]|nr:glycoside hydrolase family 3 C-terminal domain-containing protein [Anaerolineae bacterium]
LKDALAAGQVDPALVDAAVANMLRLKFELGLFENPYVDADATTAIFDTPEQRALARRVAQESIVLLKNEGGLLPLDGAPRKIAVIGPSADSIRLLQGDYHYPAHLEHVASQQDYTPGDVPHAALPRPDDLDAIQPYYVRMVTLLEGIRQQAGPGAEILYAKGCDVTAPDTSGIEEAVAIASQSDVVIVAVGGKSGLDHSSTSGEAVDRLDLTLPGVQQQLVEAIAATGKPVVVVLINGRPLAIPWIAANVPAVIEAWLPGEEGGSAVADVIFGKVNPAGRLPMSLPHHVGQIPVFYNHKPSGGRSHWYGDYVDGSVKPLYPFGHGLSYTTFDYANLQVSAAETGANSAFTVSVDITNAGERPGDEVVQLYIHDRVASVTRPVKELKAFKRLSLQPGETRTVSFAMHTSQLAFYDLAMNLVVEPGEIEIMVGASSDDIRQTGLLTITGESFQVTQPQYITPVTVR